MQLDSHAMAGLILIQFCPSTGLPAYNSENHSLMSEQKTLSEKKLRLVKHLKEMLEGRAKLARQGIEAATESRNADTKSSAGDKYETGREMIQQEIDKLSSQLRQLRTQLQVLERIPTQIPVEVTFGSLTLTDKGYYFLAMGLGKVDFEGNSYFCISVGAPMGKALLGKHQNETATFQQLTLKVMEIA